MDKKKSLVAKYKRRLQEELNSVTNRENIPEVTSKDYKEFKQSFLPRHLTLYEKMCQFSEKVLKVKPDPKRSKELQEAISITHLSVTPTGTLSFAILIPLLILVFGTLIAFVIFQSLFFAAFFAVGSLILIIPLQKLPDFLANNWRLKSSNQMVQCVFYVVTYMRHTSNLERAIEFASNHVGPPLSLDLKKILWDVETAEFDTIKESLEHYLDSWKKWNKEFIEAFHLIEGSLYEGSESRRLDVLDKALSVILTETYEKMLHYAHNLQNPVTMLHMLGVILPILGLVILPLVVSFLAGDDTTPRQLALIIASIYNVFLPVTVYFLTKVVLSKRPTGYGQADISESNPELSQTIKNKISPSFLAVFTFFVLFLIGVSPLIIHFVSPGYELTFLDDKFELLGYVCPKGIECALEDRIGPYGLGAAILSLFITLGIGIGCGLYYALRSKNVYGLREKTKKLEDEFASALFQFGNKLGDGLPAEIAFGKVAEVTQNTTSGNFFSLVNQNIRRKGMSVEEAIFNKKTGALVFFPSKVIESSMKVLIESSKKGPKIAAQALLSMSRYIKEIHRVDERLKDLLADIISSMKGQIKFLTPAIAGIVVGISSMITTILNKLSKQIAALTQQGSDLSSSGFAAFDPNLFGSGVPAYHFQIIVGIYVVQITAILTLLSSGIENGSDKLNERYLLGQNIIRSTVLYIIISLFVMLMFNFIAGSIISQTFT